MTYYRDNKGRFINSPQRSYENLSPRDFNLLKKLISIGPDRYVDITLAQAISVHYLRKELGRENILTANRVGYRITEEGRRRAEAILKRVSQDE